MNKKQGGDKGFARKLQEVNRKAMVHDKVVHLTDYRNARYHEELQTILVIDDEQVMRAALQRIFEKEKFKVISAKDAVEFSQILEETIPDIILLDVGLPWVSGYELCKMLKEHAVLSNVPVVMISGNKTEEDIQKGYDAGADHYVCKPFEVDELCDIVYNLLNEKTRA